MSKPKPEIRFTNGELVALLEAIEQARTYGALKSAEDEWCTSAREKIKAELALR